MLRAKRNCSRSVRYAQCTGSCVRQTDIREHGSVGTVSTGVLTGSAFQLLGVVVDRGGGGVVTGTSSPKGCVVPMADVYNAFRSNDHLERHPPLYQPSISNGPT